MANRGRVTNLIRAKAKELLDIDDIGTDELRLMPYIQYVMVNEQKLVMHNINAVDRKILSRWRKNGWIEGGLSGLAITKEFWDAIIELIWMAYVAYREEDQHG